MPLIQRLLPPWHGACGVAGDHIFGETAVTFDADGLALVGDPAVLALMQAFPDTFVLVEGAQAAGGMAAAFDRMTVTELQDLATLAHVPHPSRLRKQELIDALLQTPGPVVPQEDAPCPPPC